MKAVSPHESDRRRAMALREKDGFYDDSSAALRLDRKAKPERIHESDLRPDISLKDGSGAGSRRRAREKKPKPARKNCVCDFKNTADVGICQGCGADLRAKSNAGRKPKDRDELMVHVTLRVKQSDIDYAKQRHAANVTIGKIVQQGFAERMAQLREEPV